MTFDEWLRETLDRNGWTQEEFATRAEIPYSTFNAYFSRKTSPMPDKLRGFSQATGTSMRRLLIMCGYALESDFRSRSLSKDEEELLHWYAQVPPESRSLVVTMLRGTIHGLRDQPHEYSDSGSSSSAG